MMESLSQFLVFVAEEGTGPVTTSYFFDYETANALFSRAVSRPETIWARIIRRDMFREKEVTTKVKTWSKNSFAMSDCTLYFSKVFTELKLKTLDRKGKKHVAKQIRTAKSRNCQS